MTTTPSSASTAREPHTDAAPPARPRRLGAIARVAIAFALPWLLLETGLRVTDWQPPDHWDFAVAGAFLDVGDRHACGGLAITPPRNAGYALIAGNWERRPHGFYFERLADACVYDGRDPACPGEHAFLAHEFVPDESFVLDLALARHDDAWWLVATVASPDDGTGTRELGHMRLRVDEPCWLAEDDAGRAAVIVIPGADPATLRHGTRVDVSEFAWERVGEVPA